MVGAHAAPLKPSPLALAQRVQRTNGLGSTIRASAGSGRVEHAQKCELASVKILAISASTKHSRSVVHAAPIQRPSVQFALARAAEATARATGRVLQSFEQTLSESLSQPASYHPRQKRVAPRRRLGVLPGFIALACVGVRTRCVAAPYSSRTCPDGVLSGVLAPHKRRRRASGTVEVDIEATGTPSPRASHI